METKFLKLILPLILISTYSCQPKASENELKLEKENKELKATISLLENSKIDLQKQLDAITTRYTKEQTLQNKANLYFKYKSENKLDESQQLKAEIIKIAPESNIAKALELIQDSEHNPNATTQAENQKTILDESKRVDLSKLKPEKSYTAGDVGILINKVTTNKKWIFDNNNYDYHYREADKGSIFIVIDFTVKSKNKNPDLPVFVVGKSSKEGLSTIVGISDIKFPSWTNYGAYLGNYSDFKNDFAKRDTIRFTAAIQVPEEDYKSKKLFLFMPNINCASRLEGSGSPPISYATFLCEEKIKDKEDLAISHLIKVFN